MTNNKQQKGKSMLYFNLLSEEDLELVFNWRLSDHVTKYMVTDIDNDYDKHIAWYNNHVKGNPNNLFWIIANENHEKLGIFNLKLLGNKQATFGIYIGNMDLHVKGLGTQIMTSVLDYIFCDNDQIESINFEALSNNKPAIYLYQKMGFTMTELLKEQIEKNNIKHDIQTGILNKTDWLKHRASLSPVQYKFIQG